MTHGINHILEKFNQNPGASALDIQECEANLGLNLPAEYAELLKTTNGGEGFIQESYLILWRTDEIGPLNQSYEVEKYAQGFLVFGSNGGGEAYGLDMRNEACRVVQIPFIGMSWNEAQPMGESFNAFLEQLFKAE
jgi:hypothetical protein